MGEPAVWRLNPNDSRKANVDQTRERRLIEATLRHTHGDKSAAAGLLGITRRTIYRRLGENEAEAGDAS